jgi:hypothetical protein
VVGLLEKNINTGFTDLVLEIDGRMVGYSTNPITSHVHHIEKRQKNILRRCKRGGLRHEPGGSTRIANPQSPRRNPASQKRTTWLRPQCLTVPQARTASLAARDISCSLKDPSDGSWRRER